MKTEIRSTKSETNSKQKIQIRKLNGFWIFCLWILYLFRISCFGFRTYLFYHSMFHSLHAPRLIPHRAIDPHAHRIGLHRLARIGTQ